MQTHPIQNFVFYHQGMLPKIHQCDTQHSRMVTIRLSSCHPTSFCRSIRHQQEGISQDHCTNKKSKTIFESIAIWNICILTVRDDYAANKTYVHGGCRKLTWCHEVRKLCQNQCALCAQLFLLCRRLNQISFVMLACISFWMCARTEIFKLDWRQIQDCDGDQLKFLQEATTIMSSRHIQICNLDGNCHFLELCCVHTVKVQPLSWRNVLVATLIDNNQLMDW